MLKSTLKRIPLLRKIGGHLWRKAPYAWRRFTPEYHKWLKHLHNLERQDEATVRSYQFAELQRLVSEAYNETPFYREHYEAHGFEPSQLRSQADITKIPPITREHLAQHSEEMVRRRFARAPLSRNVTSGTTGLPVTTHLTPASRSRELASIHYMWGRVGYTPGEWRIELRGLVEGDAPFARLPDERALRINVNHLNRETLPKVLEALRSEGHRTIHGYPSAIEKFASLLLSEGAAGDLPPIDRVLLASEQMLDWQLERIRNALPTARLFAHYGQAERVAQGGWFGESERYHFTTGYGIVEQNSSDGTLIGTALTQEAMPLIRYQLSDRASGFQRGPAAAQPGLFPVVERIEGRLEDYVYRPDGEMIPPAIVTFPFKQGETFSAVQIIQHELDRIELLVETSHPQSAVDAEFARVQSDLATVFGPHMRYEVTCTAHIPRQRSGKFRWIVSKLPAEVRRDAKSRAEATPPTPP